MCDLSDKPIWVFKKKAPKQESFPIEAGIWPFRPVFTMLSTFRLTRFVISSGMLPGISLVPTNSRVRVLDIFVMIFGKVPSNWLSSKAKKSNLLQLVKELKNSDRILYLRQDGLCRCWTMINFVNCWNLGYLSTEFIVKDIKLQETWCIGQWIW